jgi:flagellar M-ring protein FliF
MASINQFLSDASATRKLVFAFMVLAILGLSAGIYQWSHQVEFSPLFNDLTEDDAAKVLKQLDEHKVEYQLSNNGRTVLVDATAVDETRIKLDGSSLAFRGGQGFEIFDDADYGMTEFVQKINYQRALQGEIARTIIGLEEVKHARVHIVLPEDRLFKSDKRDAKASVTVILEPDSKLTAAQIAGIQRLVASAVDSMGADNVIVLDERGVVLTKTADDADGEAMANLGTKQDIEQYLAKKALTIVDQLYGSGRSVVNVDVSLGRNRTQVTNESWSAPNSSGTGGMVASMKTQKKYSGAANAYEGNPKSSLTSEMNEVDYRIDKQIQQVVEGEGQIERMTVSVLVPHGLADEELSAVKELVAGAVGLQAQRGDVIGIFALQQYKDEGALGTVFAPGEPADIVARARQAAMPSPPADHDVASKPAAGTNYAFLLLIALVLAGAALMWSRRSSKEKQMPQDERSAMLADVQQWFHESATLPPDTESTRAT